MDETLSNFTYIAPKKKLWFLLFHTFDDYITWLWGIFIFKQWAKYRFYVKVYNMHFPFPINLFEQHVQPLWIVRDKSFYFVSVDSFRYMNLINQYLIAIRAPAYLELTWHHEMADSCFCRSFPCSCQHMFFLPMLS